KQLSMFILDSDSVSSDYVGRVLLQIYVVKSGDALFSIANTFDTSIEAITEANELETPNLVVGQSLVLPFIGQYYFVQEGDSLFSIARQFNTSVEILARTNQILPSIDRKSTRLNSSHVSISYAVFCS